MRHVAAGPTPTTVPGLRHPGSAGPATAAEDLGRLFGRFYRASKAAEQAIPGTGLGLAIATSPDFVVGGSAKTAEDPDQPLLSTTRSEGNAAGPATV